MPEISRFFGIIVKMYFIGSEHNPPHLHAEYNEYKIEVNINTTKIIAGSLPKREKILLLTWIKEHQAELLEIWYKQKFKKIKSLEEV
ncbi:MAG: DUF4160 domain-containing protein [Elusimicrobiota bacterium]|jgi:hypothetical protein|nr:DUF4160 domain-containing protein [Elusimicrobiota bacterium]